MAKVKPHALAATLRPRYRKASKARRGAILDSFVKRTGYHRKAAIRLLNNPPKRRRRG